MTTETAAPASFTGGPDLPQERRVVTEIPGPRSRELQERRTAAVASGVGSVLPVYVAAAGGGVILDVDGNSLIDLASGIAVTSVGNSAPEVVRRVSEQVAAFTHTCFMVAPYEGYLEVCEALARVTPGDHAKKAALFNSGAEAVENAVKIARAHTGRDAVAVFDHAYHGRTNLTMAMTAKNLPYKHGFGPFAGEVYRAPMSYPFREASELTGAQAAGRAIDVIEKQVGADNLACVVIEPVLGEGGYVPVPPAFLTGLRERADAHGILLVADEVQTGFGRTGRFWGHQHAGVAPDVLITAKGLASGFPLSGIAAPRALMEKARPGSQGGTYGGNAVACAAALATLDVIADEGLVANAAEQGLRLRDGLRKVAADHPGIADVRGLGLMVGNEFCTPDGAPDPAAATRAHAAAAEGGLLLLTCGPFGNVVRMIPPLIVTADQVDEGVALWAEACARKSSP